MQVEGDGVGNEEREIGEVMVMGGWEWLKGGWV